MKDITQLTPGEQEAFFDRFKHSDIAKLLELKFRLASMKKSQKLELVDLILSIRRADITGLKAFARQFKRDGNRLGLQFATSLLDQALAAAVEEKRAARSAAREKKHLSRRRERARWDVKNSAPPAVSTTAVPKGASPQKPAHRLRELSTVSQHPGEPFRRWFTGAGLDLIVWEEPIGTVIGFQLCYEKAQTEKALTWINGRGYSHNRIDDGEGRPARHKMTPVLLADGLLDKSSMSSRFADAAQEIDSTLREFVSTKLNEYPET